MTTSCKAMYSFRSANTDEIGSFILFDEYLRVSGEEPDTDTEYNNVKYLRGLKHFVHDYTACRKSSERIKIYNRFLMRYGYEITKLAEAYNFELSKKFEDTPCTGYVYTKLPKLESVENDVKFRKQIQFLRDLLKMYPTITGMFACTRHGTGFAHVYVSCADMQGFELPSARSLLYSKDNAHYDDCIIVKLREGDSDRLLDLSYSDIYPFIAKPLIDDAVLPDNHHALLQQAFPY